MDGYRDDLQAAQARITQLEAELEALREGKVSATRPGGQRIEGGPQSPVPAVRALVSDYKQKLAAAERRVEELDQELARERADRKAERATAQRLWAQELGQREDMLTVTEHNRRRPPDERGELAGVLCPLCCLSGHRTEMRIVAEGASCPRCRFAQRLVT